MFEILSAIALTASASIVVAFLSYALARTSLGRLTAAGFSLAGLRLLSRLARPARSIPRGVSAFRDWA